MPFFRSRRSLTSFETRTHTMRPRASKRTKPTKRASKPGTLPVTLMVGTRKGAFLLHGDRNRRTWRLSDPLFLGHIIHHIVQDSRNRRSLVMAARTGHLGPTIFRSTDGGKRWREARRPPAFPEKSADAIVDHVFWLSPGHSSQPGVWYAGTSPPGLFRSEDGGDTWEGVTGFNAHPNREAWLAQGNIPGGAIVHSVLIDPRDPEHLYLAVSAGGVFESTDGGKDWRPLNRGCAADFLPDPDVEYGHDPHRVALHPLLPDRLYQQNHCGIYRLDRPASRWVRIGENMPRKVGDIGFPIVLHPRSPGTAWVFPMDGTTVWPRTSPEGKPAAYVTQDAGRKWTRLDRGFPTRQAWWTVKRQAMSADACNPVGLYVGTSSGEIWGSRDEGKRWFPIARHLPEIYSIEVAVGIG